MSPQTLEGQNLGKYRVLEALGRGGMAQVYRAYHPQLDRYVAIKVLRSDLVEETEFLARFHREARSVGALRHPNIVQIYDFDVQDDLYYMVMELMEGDTLKSYLSAYRTRNERIPWGDMMRILFDALAGLNYAHQEGIIHRDIKPANIMLTRRGQAVLTDFGVAQIIGGTQYTVSGALMGTLNYMAPEQGLQGCCDSRSDIYSLGVVFYEMMTGKPPFDADTPLAILLKHLNDPLPLPHKMDPSIPEALERVVLKALAKQPEDRFQTCTEMVDALHQAVLESGIVLPETIQLPSLPQTPTPVGIATRIELAQHRQAVDTKEIEPGSNLTEEDAPAAEMPVGVFSGTARERIKDASFAADDTDVRLADSIYIRTAKIELEKALDVLERIKPKAEKIRPIGIVVSVLLPLAVFIGMNLTAIGVEAATKTVSIYATFWPAEFVLISLLLFTLQGTLANKWLFIPGGILLGTGMLLFFFAFTGSWALWMFLWSVQAGIIFLSIYLPNWLENNEQRWGWIIRPAGYALALFALFYASLISLLSFLRGLFG